MQVRTENLTMEYNDAGRVISIFRALNLDIKSGDSVAIVGESGVGKSTLLNLISALEVPSQGEIYIGDFCLTEAVRSGKDVAPFRGENIGLIFQFHQLLPEFDAVENVAMPLIIRGMVRKEARERASELLARVGLSGRFSHRPGTLSGGEQQRVAIARAIAGKPGVILADEPTGNLDHKTAHGVQQLLLELHKTEKTTLFIVTHSLDLAKELEHVFELTPDGLIKRSLA